LTSSPSKRLRVIDGEDVKIRRPETRELKRLTFAITLRLALSPICLYGRKSAISGNKPPDLLKLTGEFPMLLKHPSFTLMAVLMLSLAGNAQQAQRLFQPEDLFRLWQVGAAAWSPDGRYAAIEILRPGHTLVVN
jgi:hypothetical protein